ncbi:MAG: rhodanese-like domain-containing protein [Asticcacaulis sp.]|nr:rhodanese-like domain-containing protein [Asticcacaulis sp.]
MSLPPALTNLTPHQVAEALDAGRIVLIDVREPYEFQAERIAGSINLPLSMFDSRQVTAPDGKTVVISCAGGVRSARAVQQCRLDGVDVTDHLAGGINAWKMAGLPTER